MEENVFPWGKFGIDRIMFSFGGLFVEISFLGSTVSTHKHDISVCSSKFSSFSTVTASSTYILLLFKGLLLLLHPNFDPMMVVVSWGLIAWCSRA